ncbi:hypothetical protein ZWY2020_014575 [Hordeum vulgare]|nr:hypothetical protein ZWY2020_014575 [Hordeum vulgare]
MAGPLRGKTGGWRQLEGVHKAFGAPGKGGEVLEEALAMGNGGCHLVTGAKDRIWLAHKSLSSEEVARALEVLFPGWATEVPGRGCPVYCRADQAELVVAPLFDKRWLIQVDLEETMELLEDSLGTGFASIDNDTTRSKEESSGQPAPPLP